MDNGGDKVLCQRPMVPNQSLQANPINQLHEKVDRLALANAVVYLHQVWMCQRHGGKCFAQKQLLIVVIWRQFGPNHFAGNGFVRIETAELAHASIYDTHSASPEDFIRYSIVTYFLVCHC